MIPLTGKSNNKQTWHWHNNPPKNTLLSSQRTNTHHQQNHPQEQSRRGALVQPYRTLCSLSSCSYQLDLKCPAPAKLTRSLTADRKFGGFQQDRPVLRFAATRPAPCRLNHFTRSASQTQIRPCRMSAPPSTASFLIGVRARPGLTDPSGSRWQRKSYAAGGPNVKLAPVDPRHIRRDATSHWPGRSGHIGREPADAPHTWTRLNGDVGSEGLAGLVAPAWQATIGVCVLAVTVVAGRTLARRGPSRMNRAVLVCGLAILGVLAVGFLLASR
jgi:hypothetical protein